MNLVRILIFLAQLSSATLKVAIKNYIFSKIKSTFSESGESTLFNKAILVPTQLGNKKNINDEIKSHVTYDLF